jgi:tRNA nucleotidyltransferase (CCA-adding enzyme)
LLEKLSGDRIRHELDHILNEPNVTLILSRLNELGLLKIINQSIPWNTWLEDKFSHLDKFPPPGEWSLNSNIDPVTFRRNFCYCIWFARNTEEECKIIIKRLRMQSLLATSVLSTCLLWHKLPVMKNAKPSEIVNFLEKSSELARYTVHTVLDDEVLKQLLMKYNQVWSKIYPFTNGTYLRAQKIAPGPHYRLILLKLRNAWLDGEISTQDEELDYLHSLIDELPYLVH